MLFTFVPKFARRVLMCWALWGLERETERSFPFLCYGSWDAKQR